MSDICPDAEYLYSQNSSSHSVMYVDVPWCSYSFEDGSITEYTLPDYTADQGVVYGMCGAFATFCKIHVKVPRYMRVQAYVERLEYWCEPQTWSAVIKAWKTRTISCGFHTLKQMTIESPHFQMYFASTNNPSLKIKIHIIKHYDIIIKYRSETSGYIIAPYTLGSFVSDLMGNLTAPPGNVIVLSVQQSYMMVRICSEEKQHVNLIYSNPNINKQIVEYLCTNCTSLVKAVFTSYLHIQIFSYLNSVHDIRMYFSTHSVKDQLKMISGSLFNCSVSQYREYQKHLHCNLKSECEDGRDETDQCPFSSADCQGLVASRHKCYKLIVHEAPLPFTIFDYYCKIGWGKLVSIKTRREQEDILPIFQNYYNFNVILGFKSGWDKLPFAYSRFRIWSDGTLIYNMNHFRVSRPYLPARTAQSIVFRALALSYARSIEDILSRAALCEIPVGKFVSKMVICLSNPLPPMFRNTRQLLVVQTDSHVTHTFLSYNTPSLSSTFANQSAGLVHNKLHTYTMFTCENDMLTVSFTLVCDLRQDCPDTSDESFCKYPNCDGYLCSIGHCVLNSQRCNEFSDCLDDSDEVGCPEPDIEECAYCHTVKEYGQKRVFFTNLDGTGYFTQQLMKDEQSCPDTHYRCPTEWLYCHPVYTRCNGFSDCIHGEDEQGCETMTCPGLYKCRASSVCVCKDHLCDGWAQCPQRDDEVTCDMECPEECQCQGHSFLCSSPFPADLFPQLHYVDATGSKMGLAMFNIHTNLIRLTLSHCSLVNISAVKLMNLQFIDLADNHLKTLDLVVFLALSNLRVLQLANNPLRQVTKTKDVHYELRRLVMCSTDLEVLENELSIYLPEIRYFNVSFSAVSIIKSVGFKNMPTLNVLDLRGNSVRQSPLDLFSRSPLLRDVFSSDYKYCCELLLPTQSPSLRCFAPDTALPSCKRIIPVELYRIFFAGVSVSAILGNVVCFVTSLVYIDVFGINVLIAIAHLQLANVCMGSHVSITLIADKMYQGQYILFEKTWTNSVTCKVAWFLSFLSCEVSVFIICLVTLDHVIVLCFPRVSWGFGRVSTAVSCTVIWFVGISLSSIPFLPGMSDWQIYGSSGLCRVALLEHYRSEQELFWCNVFMTVNFILCLMIAAGQAAVYRNTPKYRILLDPAKRPMYSSVHLMGKVAVTDTICWFSLGLNVIMVSNGNVFSNKFHGAMVIFVLPINSALNPLLYLWAVATQRRRQAREDKLIEVFKSRLYNVDKKN